MSYASRRQSLVRRLKNLKLDALLISNPINVTYLTGFTGEASFLVIAPKRQLLITDGRFVDQLAEECPGLGLHVRPPTTTTPPEVAKVLTNLGFRSVGFESSHLTVAGLESWGELAPAISWSPQKELVEELRMIKDESEIEQIREAIVIAERAFAMFRAMIEPNDSEIELCHALEMYIRRAGGLASSFPSIVAVGARSALAHAPPKDCTIDSADWLLVDWGASGTYYKSDLTRMLVTRRSWFRPRTARPRPDDPRLAKVYAAVLAAQDRAMSAIRPGVHAKDVDAAARSALANVGFADYFTHGLGHGIGLQVHEAPDLRASSTRVLQPGMVVTIEPGVYFPGWGGVRIEDDVLVTPEGYERLTTLPRDFGAAQL